MPLAYFITFSAYGTWLHSASKGKGSVDRDHNQFSTPYIHPDKTREARERDTMKQPAMR